MNKFIEKTNDQKLFFNIVQQVRVFMLGTKYT